MRVRARVYGTVHLNNSKTPHLTQHTHHTACKGHHIPLTPIIGTHTAPPTRDITSHSHPSSAHTPHRLQGTSQPTHTHHRHTHHTAYKGHHNPLTPVKCAESWGIDASRGRRVEIEVTGAIGRFANEATELCEKV